MKIHNVLFTISLVLLTLNSCKKGCTDPYATNYNSKKTKDNGKCEFYSNAILHSVDVKKIPSKNANGHLWDAGQDNDLDNDNTYPDLYLWFKAEGGYTFMPSYYEPTINPNNVNRNFSLDPTLTLSDWKNEKGFWIFFDEADLGASTFEPMDSFLIKPFDKNASYNRFKDTMNVNVGDFEFTVNMSWE
jgi:hypothetical protein